MGILYKYQNLHRKKFKEFEVEIKWKMNNNINERFLGKDVKYDPELTRVD